MQRFYHKVKLRSENLTSVDDVHQLISESFQRSKLSTKERGSVTVAVRRITPVTDTTIVMR